MKTMCIYCCGGMGREIADMIYRMNVSKDKWSSIIFVNDNIVNRVVDGIEVFTLDKVLNKFDNDELEFIVTAGEPTTRQVIY